jgi:diguanylate cyclase
MAGQAEQDGMRGSAQNAALLLKIAQTMAKLGISPLPRNYELFHEALSGQSPALSRELAALGAGASQAQLDAIGERHNLIGHPALAAEKARAGAADAIAELQTKLQKNIEAKSRFSESLQAFISRLESDPVTGMSDFADDATRFGYAATALLREEQAFAGMLDDISGQLRDTGADLAASRKAVTRDPVTGLPNRTAFSMRLAALFGEDTEIGASALVLITIDGLQALGETHGKAPVEKLLKKLAALFKKSIKKNDFVARIGSDEFAFIFDDLSADNAATIAARIRASVEAIEIALPNRAFTKSAVSLSAGIAMGQSATGATDLFQQADLALKAVRAEGGSGVLVFSSAIGSQAGKSRWSFVA